MKEAPGKTRDVLRSVGDADGAAEAPRFCDAQHLRGGTCVPSRNLLAAHACRREPMAPALVAALHATTSLAPHSLDGFTRRVGEAYKYSCVVSYDGGKFSGWQTQPDCVTVQESLENALSLLNGSRVRVTGAGRTDAGVHARGQVASFSMNRVWQPRRLLLALNANVPDGMAIVSVQPRAIHFDARRSALWREYAYFVWRGSFCYPMIRPYVWWKKKDNWDHERIRAACRLLEGQHDFSAFCRADMLPENPIRRMHFVRCIRRGNFTIFRIRGDAFMTNMVRIMVGNLDAVGSGARSLSWLARLLDGERREDSAMTVPSSGLFFWKVGYKE